MPVLTSRPCFVSFRMPLRARHLLCGIAAALTMVGVVTAAPVGTVGTVSAAGTYNVNTTADGPDSNAGDGQCHMANGSCSLRAAIQQANSSSGATTINLPAGVYRLNAGATGEFNGSHALQIGAGNGAISVTINGAGSSTTQIVGNPGYGVFDVRKFYGANTTAASLTVNKLTITGGNSALGAGMYIDSGTSAAATDVVFDGNAASGGGSYGGAIYTYGPGAAATTTLTRVTMIRNSAVQGGAIVNGWPNVMTITDSSVTYNVANGPYGGGIRNLGTMTVNNTLIAHNTAGIGNLAGAPGGGGVYTGNPYNPAAGQTSTFTMNGGALDSNVVPNSLKSSGGGMLNETGGTATLNTVVVSNNSAYTGGGILNDEGTTNLVDTTIVNNTAMFGGGLYNNDFIPTNGFNATMNLQRTVVFANKASIAPCHEAPTVPCGAGGGLFSENAQTTIANSTIAENRAGTFGGGIYLLRVSSGSQAQGATHLRNATVSANAAGTEDFSVFHREAGGILVNGSAVDFLNTIVADNTMDGAVNDCFKVPSQAPASTTSTLGHNLQSDGRCWASLPSDKVGAAKLSAVRDNGGATLSMMPKGDSPALNAGDNAACAASPVSNLDQRIVARPLAGTCDIGAVEGAVVTVQQNRRPPVRVEPKPHR